MGVDSEYSCVTILDYKADSNLLLQLLPHPLSSLKCLDS